MTELRFASVDYHLTSRYEKVTNGWVITWWQMNADHHGPRAGERRTYITNDQFQLLVMGECIEVEDL